MYWIPTIVFLIHVAEEYPSFPAWATKHFGITSRAWYVYSHIPLIAGIVAVSALAEAKPGTIWPLLATAGQFTLASNALFHLVTTFLFREYSPGVVTGVTLFFPATAYLLHRTASERLLSGSDLAFAAAAGTLAGAAVIGSLWLRMDIDWRLRRRREAGDPERAIP